jgi:hypothetical protein
VTRRRRTGGKLEAARAATTESLLRAGAELLADNPVGDVLSQLKATAIAARAGRTTGAFFNIWPTQDAYRTALLGWIRQERVHSRRAVEQENAAVLKAQGPDVRLTEIVRGAANANFRALMADPMTRLEIALWAFAASRSDVEDESTAKARGEAGDYLRALYDEVDRDLVPTYTYVLDALGRRMRPGWTVDDLAVSLTALVQGLLMRAVVDPDSVPDSPPGDAQRWSFFARVALELVHTMSEPGAPETDRRAVFDVAGHGEPAPQLVLTAGDGKLDIELHFPQPIEDGRIAVEFSIDDCAWSVPLSSDPAKALWRGRMPWNGTPPRELEFSLHLQRD